MNIEKTLHEWVDEIKVEWRKSVQGIIECGRLTANALDAIPHGEKDRFYNLLPFSQRTAQRIVSIAQDPRLSNPTHASLLPPSWYTLYELTKLDDDTWADAVEQGKIRADMQRKDVASLVTSDNHRAPRYFARVVVLRLSLSDLPYSTSIIILLSSNLFNIVAVIPTRAKHEYP